MKFPLSSLKATLLIILFIWSFQPTHAQEHVFGGWAGWFNNIRLNESWGINNDVQFRTGKDWSTNSLLLIRPGVNYFVNPQHTASLGYAAVLLTSRVPDGTSSWSENRIWQQYIITSNILKIPVQNRFRLEQRFLNQSTNLTFAQRARYFIRGIIPLRRPVNGPLDRGMFASLQNELFFNIQNKAALNGNLFDQNRFYTSLGYRFSNQYDIELGYMNQFLIRKTLPNSFTHITQIAVYTRW